MHPLLHQYIQYNNTCVISFTGTDSEFKHCVAHKGGFEAPVVSSPVVLLLDGGGQLLVEALQVCEAHQQGVPLRPDELLGLPDILHLPIPGLKSAHGCRK